MKWSRIAENRQNIPGYSQKPAEAVPGSADTPSAETSTSDKLEKLAGLRDQGVITEEEFEAKKKQLLVQLGLNASVVSVISCPTA